MNSQNCESSSKAKEEGKKLKKIIDAKLEGFHERLDEIEANSGGSVTKEGEIAGIKQQIVILAQRIEESQTRS
jgi:uncharacterized protein YicC (UPF0701 family)